MKVLFIEARRKHEINAKELVDKFVSTNKAKSIGLVASLQYLDLTCIIKEEFEKKGIKVYSSKGVKTLHDLQIIGCDVNAALNIQNKADAFLVLSDGRFHALQLALKTEKPVFVLNQAGFKEIDADEVIRLKNKIKSSKVNFLNAKNVGVIVSTKPGQCQIGYALKLKGKIEKIGKKAFLFISNTINISELENFNCESWVNTSCPGLMLDTAKIIDSEEAEKLIRTVSAKK